MGQKRNPLFCCPEFDELEMVLQDALSQCDQMPPEVAAKYLPHLTALAKISGIKTTSDTNSYLDGWD
jgi:hypothetical protein